MVDPKTFSDKNLCSILQDEADMKLSILKIPFVIPSISLGFCEKAVGAAACLTFMFVPLASQGLPPLQVQISEILCEA